MRFNIPYFNGFLVGSLMGIIIITMCTSFSSQFNVSVPLSSFLIITSGGYTIRGNFSSIQEAINTAKEHSKIYVPAGVYFEHLIVNKTVSLIGENISTTIIDGSNNGTVVTVTADNVLITGFTIQNSGWGWTRNGIYVYKADNCEISTNLLIKNCHNIRLNYSQNSRVLKNMIYGDGYGIRLINCVNSTVQDNYVQDCIGGVHLQNATKCIVKKNTLVLNNQGIRLYSPCVNNVITENMVYNNTYDGMIEAMPGNTTFSNNLFFHNNFINNSNSFICKVPGNIWNKAYPLGGNYWSRYAGSDLYSGPYQNETGSDGIGDTSYFVSLNNFDYFPLMNPWSMAPIHNIATGIGYSTIQEAINASETSDGHVLYVASGLYIENVNVYKSLWLIGEDPITTIVDGAKVGTVLTISVDNVTVKGFTIRNSGLMLPPYGMDCGVLLDHVSGCNLSQNVITNNLIGLYLLFSKNNILDQNTVHSNMEEGICLWYSGNNTLIGNQIFNNSYNFEVSGKSFADFNNTVDTTNTVNGKPIRYLINVENMIYDQTSLGAFYLINCQNITVSNLNLTRNGNGVLLYNTRNSKITNMSLSENKYGVHIQNSFNITITYNNCSKNWVGILVQDSMYNNIWANTVANNEKGISLYEADNNLITENTILNNLYGIRLFSSSFNKAFHNNIIENTNQVDVINSYQNSWDNGLEGNFWSDYTGTDANKNGLGDMPYVISKLESDSYPLFGLFQNFTFFHNNSMYKVTVISNSTILSLKFNPKNGTIRIIVKVENGAYGFCRIRIPRSLINSQNITVIIDNGDILPLFLNCSIYDNELYRWIYFAYPHTTHEISIIPEFSPKFHILIPILFTITFSVIIACKSTFPREKLPDN